MFHFCCLVLTTGSDPIDINSVTNTKYRIYKSDNYAPLMWGPPNKKAEQLLLNSKCMMQPAEVSPVLAESHIWCNKRFN